MPEREKHMPGLVPERDGYIPGVPCAVDTGHPDPRAAADFYGGVFGWELEDVMPPEAEARYFVARLRGRDVAAVGSITEGAPRMATWRPTSGSTVPTRPRPRSRRPAGEL